MLTRKAVTLLAVGTALVTGGLYYDDGASCLIGLVLLLFVIIGSAPGPLRLHVERSLSEEVAHVGNQVSVDLSVEARSDSERIVEVQDELSSRLWLDGGVVSTMVYLGEGDRLEVGYRLYCPLRGYMRVGPLRVRSRDFFGLGWADRTIDVRDSLTVHPALDIATWRPRHLPSAIPEVGQRARGRLGMGTEFFQIRDYQEGDPYRFINWKATARLRRYMVNDFEQESSSDIMVFVDMRGAALSGTPTLNGAERAAELAACLVEQFVHQRRDVGLVIYGRRPFVLPPGTGQRQLDDVLHALTGASPGGSATFQEAYELASAHMSHRTRILVLTSLAHDETLMAKLAELGVRGRHVVLVRVEPFDFQAGIRTYRLPADQDPTRLQVDMDISGLRERGVLTMDWPVTQRPSQMLEVMRVAAP